MTPPGVTYNEKGAYWAENKPEIEKAVKAATEVDYIIACIGENSYCETPGNLTDLTLSRNQLDLVKALSATGKPASRQTVTARRATRPISLTGSLISWCARFLSA